jgi:hypothetical protein
MPMWWEYRDESGNYVPREVVAAVVDAATKEARARFTLVECYSPDGLPEGCTLSNPGAVRGEPKKYEGAWAATETEYVMEAEESSGKIRKSKTAKQ